MFTQIFITPKPLLLAQKLYAALNRPRSRGRNFFDIVFLLSLVKAAAYGYLEFKTGIKTPQMLRKRALKKCASLDMEEMARDVAPFLLNPRDTKKIIYFTDYIRQESLN